MAVKYLCRAPGCNAKIDSKGYCNEHAYLIDSFKPGYSNRPASPWIKWYQSAQWRALRRAIIKRDGCCAACGATSSLEVHHIHPHRGNVELFYSESNLQALCKHCHSIVTSLEIEKRKKEKV